MANLPSFLLILFLSFSLIAASQFEGFEPEEDPSLYEEEELDSSLPSPSLPTISLSTPLDPTPTPEPSSPSEIRDPNPSATDLWDEDEFEGISSTSDPILVQTTTQDESPESEADSRPDSASDPKPSTTRIKPSSYSVEIACVSFLICFIINYFTGKKENESKALAWAAKFATKDSIFDKNFSLLGTGDGKDTPLLLKEGQDMFKFYASGRRFCQGMLATMQMQSRHDLISRILSFVFPKPDLISFEVVMNEEAMDHVVLCVARKKEAKLMQKDEKDLTRFALPTPVAGPASRKWVSDELAVVAESKEVASDLITETVLDQVFGEKAFEKVGKWFVSLHFSDQLPGSYKKILTFKFVLPDASHMDEMTKLVALVPYYIDLIGRYKLSSHARVKTEGARAKIAQEEYKEMLNVRQEMIQRKKLERRKQLEEAENQKLSAEALRKKEEKERSRQLKKSMPKVKMMR